MRAKDVWQRLRWILALTLLCALATCPAAARRCSNRRAALEAPSLLGYQVAQVKLYVAEFHKLPAIDVGPTPDVGTCCAAGDTCAPDATRWDQPGWRTLRFSIDGRHRFSYQARRDVDALVLTAIGNQDCDSVHARYEVRLTLDGDRLIEVWTQSQPYE
jgi:hypothetical protein